MNNVSTPKGRIPNVNEFINLLVEPTVCLLFAVQNIIPSVSSLLPSHYRLFTRSMLAFVEISQKKIIIIIIIIVCIIIIIITRKEFLFFFKRYDRIHLQRK